MSEQTVERTREVSQKHKRRKGSASPENSVCESTERSNSSGDEAARVRSEGFYFL